MKLALCRRSVSSSSGTPTIHRQAPLRTIGLPAARLKGILAAQSLDLPKVENLASLFASLEDLHALLPHVAFEQTDEPVDVFLANVGSNSHKRRDGAFTVSSLILLRKPITQSFFSSWPRLVRQNFASSIAATKRYKRGSETHTTGSRPRPAD